MVLTNDVETEGHRHLGFGVHLTLVDAGVTHLWKFDLQRPVVGVLRSDHLRNDIDLSIDFSH